MIKIGEEKEEIDSYTNCSIDEELAKENMKKIIELNKKFYKKYNIKLPPEITISNRERPNIEHTDVTSKFEEFKQFCKGKVNDKFILRKINNYNVFYFRYVTKEEDFDTILENLLNRNKYIKSLDEYKQLIEEYKDYNGSTGDFLDSKGYCKTSMTTFKFNKIKNLQYKLTDKINNLILDKFLYIDEIDTNLADDIKGILFAKRLKYLKKIKNETRTR